MKKLAILSLVAIFTIGCKGQENKQENKEDENLQKDGTEEITEQPKGTWKVDKEFDENGNMIRYDSIYSWSSTDDWGDLGQNNADSIWQSFQSKFYRNFKGFDNQRFENLFGKDSLLRKHFFQNDFFDSEFGHDFMDIDRLRERLDAMKQEFWERYQSEFDSLHTKDKDSKNIK